MRFNHAVNNFSAGEWSPKMRGRTDVQQYQNACEKLLNFIPQVQGGAFRRPPTRRLPLGAAYDSDLQGAFHATNVKSKLIPYKLSNGDTGVLVTLDTLPSTTWFRINGAAPDGSETVLSVSSAADFTYAVAGLKYVQVGDVLFFAHNAVDAGEPPRVWSLTGGLECLDEYLPSKNWLSVPYRPPEALGSSVNMTAGAATGVTTLTASSAYFDSGHVGAYFKLSAAGSTGVGKVTGYTSNTQVQFTVLSTVPTVACGTAAGTSWEESAWSDYRGWPRSVTAYQGRVYFGGTKTYPDTIWGSRIGNVFDFMERPFEQDASFSTYTDDNSRPFNASPATPEANIIRAMSSSKTLLIHTDRAEIVAYGTNGALGPLDIAFESSTSFGANPPMPTRTNSYSVFVERGGRKLRDITFNFNEDQYKSNDLSFVADHMTVDEEVPELDNIVEIVGCNVGTSLVLAKTQNGRLLALTLDRDYQINAWSRIQFGGSSESKSWPLVKSVCAVPHTNGDRVFLIICRRINGANVVFLEYMDIPKETSNVPSNVVGHMYADLHYRYTPNGAGANDLSHLIGETVQVIADGLYIGEKVVDSSGEIDLGGATYTDITCGLKYESTCITMPIEIGQQIPDTALALFKRINEVSIKFWNTYGAKYGRQESDLFDIDFRDAQANMNDPITLWTGTQRLVFPGTYSQEAQVVVYQDKPFPCNIVAIVAKGVTSD